MRELDQRVRVEGRQRPGDESGAPAAGPALHQQAERPPGQRQSGEQRDVVSEHRRAAEREHRHRQHALHEHRFGIRERAMFRIENIGLEQLRRLVRERMAYPADDPDVERAVTGSTRDQCAGARGERPGVQHRQQQERGQ